MLECVHGNTALVTSRWTEKSTNKGKPFAGTLLYTTVYVKNNGKWQIVSDQGTLVTRRIPGFSGNCGSVA